MSAPLNASATARPGAPTGGGAGRIDGVAEGRPRRLGRPFRRARCEAAATTLIGLGLVMLMQPWSLALYTHSFAVLLAGVVGLSVAVKLPE